ncbi:MAG: carboxypeptidase-like regulatory domain-containing protein [Segetibacter sp.]
MKNNKILLLFSFLLWTIPILAFSQNSTNDNIILKGVITEQESNLPLSYVSIGIIDKPVGTISDTSGNYSLVISKENLSDTLQISLVGYKTNKISVNEFILTNDKNVKLTRRTFLLPKVIVTNKKRNAEIIGRQESGKLIQVSVHNKKTADETIGSEMGMRIKTKRSSSLLKDLNWYFSANNFRTIKFRVNIYSIKNNFPDTLLCNKQIFATVENFKTGWNKIYLEPYNIVINGDFIITLQWIESKMDKKKTL